MRVWWWQFHKGWDLNINRMSHPFKISDTLLWTGVDLVGNMFLDSSSVFSYVKQFLKEFIYNWTFSHHWLTLVSLLTFCNHVFNIWHKQPVCSRFNPLSMKNCPHLPQLSNLICAHVQFKYSTTRCIASAFTSMLRHENQSGLSSLMSNMAYLYRSIICNAYPGIKVI